MARFLRARRTLQLPPPSTFTIGEGESEERSVVTREETTPQNRIPNCRGGKHRGEETGVGAGAEGTIHVVYTDYLLVSVHGVSQGNEIFSSAGKEANGGAQLGQRIERTPNEEKMGGAPTSENGKAIQRQQADCVAKILPRLIGGGGARACSRFGVTRGSHLPGTMDARSRADEDQEPRRRQRRQWQGLPKESRKTRKEGALGGDGVAFAAEEEGGGAERGWWVGWRNEGSVAGKMRASVSPHTFPYISPVQVEPEQAKDRPVEPPAGETDDRREKRRTASLDKGNQRNKSN
ncbi:hypothetical protein WN55_07470 [Dufourea novaeangliae]|uniref:Uncharacterized protein n=1 Tax=Dufourea novaeangliae TaxID=178035 RepID=A0A154PS43_DUFNO|nr:hypothetical protein WN55_07470 [Dufourea novaeangliae]